VKLDLGSMFGEPIPESERPKVVVLGTCFVTGCGKPATVKFRWRDRREFVCCQQCWDKYSPNPNNWGGGRATRL
jgi:hypothetical protein